MVKNNITKISIMILLVLFLSSSVLAFGIAPAKKGMNFEPNLQKEIDFLVLSKGDEQIYFDIELEGDIVQYATLDKTKLFMDYEDTKKGFKLNLKFDSELSEGEHILYVKLIEQEDVNNEAMASTKNALVSQIIVNVPYQGVHVEGKFDAQKGEVNSPVQFTVALYGRGQSPADCFATFDIKGPTNELIDTVISDKVHVGVGESTKIETFWEGTSNEGIYLAEANVKCEDKSLFLTDKFYVGDPSVSILLVEAKNFILGEIAPIDATVKNNWNSKFNDVFIDYFVLDNQDKVVQNFKSQSMPLDARGLEIIRGYWETENLLMGDYTLNLVAYFDDVGSSQKSYRARVELNNLKLTEITGQVTGSGDGEYTEPPSEISLLSNKIALFTLLIIVLIVLNISLFIMVRKKMK